MAHNKASNNRVSSRFPFSSTSNKSVLGVYANYNVCDGKAQRAAHYCSHPCKGLQKVGLKRTITSAKHECRQYSQT